MEQIHLSDSEYRLLQVVWGAEPVGSGQTFGGSLPGFLTAFMGGRKLTAKEAEDLKRLIETYQEG